MGDYNIEMELKISKENNGLDIDGQGEPKTPEKLIDELSQNVGRAIIGKADVIRHALIT